MRHEKFTFVVGLRLVLRLGGYRTGIGNVLRCMKISRNIILFISLNDSFSPVVMISSELTLINLFLVNVLPPRTTSFVFDLIMKNYSVTNSTGATQGFSANHKTSSEQKNRSSSISDQSQMRDLR